MAAYYSVLSRRTQNRLAWAVGLLLILQLHYLPQAHSQAIDLVQLAGTAISTGGSSVRSTTTDSNGNLYVMGAFSTSLQLGTITLTSAGASDFFVAKMSPGGQWLWAVRGGGTGTDGARKIVLETSGLLRVVGSFTGPTLQLDAITLTASPSANFVAQLTTDGAWQSAATVALPPQDPGVGPSVDDIAVDADGSIIVTGAFSFTLRLGAFQLTTAGFNKDFKDIYVAKLSPAGTWVWAVRAGGDQYDDAVAVALDAAGNVYLTGNFKGGANFGTTNLYVTGGCNNCEGNPDVFVAKLSPAGAWLWAVQGGSAYADGCGAFVLDAAGNAYVTGYFDTTQGSMTGGGRFGTIVLPHSAASNYDVFVAKVSTAGVWQWANRAVGVGGREQGTSVAVDAPGNVYVGGTYTSPSCAFGSYTCTNLGGTDTFIAKLNPTGAWQWGFGVGTTGTDLATTVAADPQGRAYLGGNLPTAVAFGTPSQTLAAPKGFIARVGNGLPDLVVNTTTTIPTGTYNSITINSSGSATLAGNVSVLSSTTINDGGTLNDGCFVLSGAGSFMLKPGGTLGVCSAAGIAASGATGAIQNTGPRSFSAEANYVYNGTATQSTGLGLPAQVRSLSTTNNSTVTLSAATSVAETLTVGGAGNLATGGNSLTLLSSSTGTALVVNSGTGIVTGATTVQRYVDGSLNAGNGYRHYAAPVSNTTLADLATSGYSPEISQASLFNNSATPGLVTPFPTLFAYDQARLATVTNDYPAFDKGFVAPTSLAAPMTVGQGYVVQIGAAQLVDFVGTPTNGDQPALVLSRNAAATINAPDAGWHLVGNPYPAPLDYSRVVPADRSGLDAAVYVVQSTGPYSGGYRAYVNGQGTSTGNNPLIASGQGFWVRVSAGTTSGRLTFRNAQRVTDYASQAAFQRPAADTRPALRLELAGAGLADAFVAYAEAGATAGFDGQFDAAKLPNTTGLNLSSAAVAGEYLAIDGQAAFTAATALPLAVGVPTAGTYTLTLASLSNLPAGLTPYLHDAQTGQTLALAVGQRYSFSVTAAQALALVQGRFTLRLGAAGVLATSGGLRAAEVGVYPNPARGRFTVVVPAVASATLLQAELLNTLGQVVRRQALPLPAAGASFSMAADGLAPGVYTLRLTAGAATLAKRVVLH